MIKGMEMATNKKKGKPSSSFAGLIIGCIIRKYFGREFVCSFLTYHLFNK